MGHPVYFKIILGFRPYSDQQIKNTQLLSITQINIEDFERKRTI